MTTVTLGTHTFEVAPAVRKRYSLNIAVLEIPDGTDEVHYMGRNNKQLTFEAEELSKSELLDLNSAWESESEVSFNIPEFEESGTCRIVNMTQEEREAVAEQEYFKVTITVMMV